MNLFGKYFVVIFVILCVSRTIPAIGSEEDDTGSMEVVSSIHHASTDDNTKPSEKLPKKMENESPVIGGASVWRSPYDSHMIGDAQHMRSGYVYELNDDPKVGASYNGVPLAHYNSRLDDDIKNFEPSFRSWDESMASFNDVDPNASLGKAPMSVETTPEKPAQKVKAPLPERDMSHLDIIAKARQMGVNAAKDSPKHHEKREESKISPVMGQAPAIQNPVVDITHLPRMTSFRTCGGGIAFRQIPEQLPQQFDQRQMPQQQQQPQQPMLAPSQQMPSSMPDQQMFDQRQLSQQGQQMPPAINQRQMMLMPGQQMPGQQMPGQQMPTQQRFDHRQMPQQQPQITPAQQNQQMPGFEQRQMPQQQPMLMPTQEMPSQMPTQQAFDQRQMPQQQPGFEQRQMPQQQPMLTPTQEMPSQMPTQQAFDQRQMPQQQPGFEQRQMPQQQPMLMPTQEMPSQMPTQQAFDQRQMPQQQPGFEQQQMPQQPESNQRQLMPQQPMQSPGSPTQPQQLWSIDGRQANPENTKTTDDQKLQKGDADEFPTDSSTKSDQRLATQEGPIVQPAALQQDLSKSEKKSDQLSGWEQDHQSITEQQKLDVQMRTQESSGGAAGNIDDVKLDEMKAAMEDMPKVGSPHFFKKKNKHGHGHGHSIIVVPGVYGGYAGGYASPSYSHYHYHTPSYPSYGGHSYGQSYGVPAYGHHGLHSAGHYHNPYGGYVGQQNPLENGSSTLAQTTDSNRQPSFPESGAPVDKEMNIKLPKRFARTSLRVADDDDLKIDEDGMVAAASDDDFSVAGSRGCVCRSNDLGEGEDDEHVAAVPIELHPDGRLENARSFVNNKKVLETRILHKRNANYIQEINEAIKDELTLDPVASHDVQHLARRHGRYSTNPYVEFNANQYLPVREIDFNTRSSPGGVDNPNMYKSLVQQTEQSIKEAIAKATRSQGQVQVINDAETLPTNHYASDLSHQAQVVPMDEYLRQSAARETPMRVDLQQSPSLYHRGYQAVPSVADLRQSLPESWHNPADLMKHPIQIILQSIESRLSSCCQSCKNEVLRDISEKLKSHSRHSQDLNDKCYPPNFTTKSGKESQLADSEENSRELNESREYRNRPGTKFGVMKGQSRQKDEGRTVVGKKNYRYESSENSEEVTQSEHKTNSERSNLKLKKTQSRHRDEGKKNYRHHSEENSEEVTQSGHKTKLERNRLRTKSRKNTEKYSASRAGSWESSEDEKKVSEHSKLKRKNLDNIIQKLINMNDSVEHSDESHRISTGLLGSTVWSQPALRPYAGLWDPTGILGRFMKPTEPLYHSPPTVGIAYVPVQKVRSKSSKRPNPRTEYDEEYDHPQVGAARTNNQKRDEASLPNCIVRPEPIVGVPGEQESNQQVGAPQSLPVTQPEVSGTIDQPAPLPNSQFLGLPQFMPLLGLPQFKPLPVPQLPQLPQWDQVGAPQPLLITQPDATIDQQEPSPNSQLLGLPQFKPLPVLQLPKLPQLQPLPDPQLALTHLKSLPDLLGSILKPASELVGAAPPPPCVPQGTGGDLVGQAQSDQRASALEGCIRGCLANSQ